MVEGKVEPKELDPVTKAIVRYVQLEIENFGRVGMASALMAKRRDAINNLDAEIRNLRSS